MKNESLTPGELALIRSVFRNHAEVREVRLFGSRAKGTNTSSSDIDLAISGEVSAIQAQAIAAELDDLPLPYRFDVQVFGSISSAALRDHIKRVGILLYPGPPANSIETCFQDIVEGRKDFWKAVGSISNEDLKAVVTLALREANGSYRKVAGLFRLTPDNYVRFMDYLRHKHCAIDPRPFRRMIPQAFR